MSEHPPVNIAILSQNVNLYSTKRLVEEGCYLGHTIHVLDIARCYLTVRATAPQIHYGDRTLTGYHVIVPRIGASQTSLGATVIRQFEAIHTATTVSSNALITSRDKLFSLQTLGAAGIQIPKTTFASHPYEIDRLVRMLNGPPVVIKILCGTQGIGVMKADTIQAARAVVEAFHAVGQYVLIQEFIESAQNRDIRAFVIGGKVVAAMERHAAPGEFRANVHRGGCAIPVQLTTLEYDTAIAAAHILGLEIAGVDMLRSSRGPLITDVNSSPGFEAMEQATSFNVANAIMRHAAALPFAP